MKRNECQHADRLGYAMESKDDLDWKDCIEDVVPYLAWNYI